MDALTKRQIRDLVRDYLKQVLERDEDRRVPGKQGHAEGEDPVADVDVITYVQDDCCRELAIGNYSRATGAVERLLETKGIELDRDGVTYNSLCREMMKAMINHLEIDMRRYLGDYSLEDLPFPELSPSQ